MVLFSHPGCPYAHRTRALLTHLQVPHELRETGLVVKDVDLTRLSPTGKVPFLLDGERVLYESQVIGDYLAERHGYPGYHDDPWWRARQRLAMRQWDDVLVPLLYYRPIRWYPLGWLPAGATRKVEAELDALEQTIAITPPDSLLGLHLAPFWLRFRLLDFLIPTAGRLSARPSLAAWLDAAADLPAVRATAPDHRYVQRYRRMRAAAWAGIAAAAAVLAIASLAALLL